MSLKAKCEQSLANLEKAIANLEEAYTITPATRIVIDGTIQRFEIMIELYWKTLKRVLAYTGITASTPREALKAAYAVDLINNESAWLEMLNDRNLTSHIYDEDTALRIHEHVKSHLPLLKETFDALKKRLDTLEA